MKIAAVVILYHPTKSVLTNIKTYYDYLEKIFVFDNSEVKSLIEDDLLALPKVEFCHNFENEGIAKRLNEGCILAIKEHFDWILTMDQDSSFSADTIITYFNCCKQFKEKEKIAMFGLEYGRYNNNTSHNCMPKKVDKLITSGSLLNLSLFNKIGKFDEALFIDSVDYDYCFRAIIAGYSIIQFQNIYLLHSVGRIVYRSSVKTFFIIKKEKEVHSALRLYYMYRNLLYLNKKYKDQEKRFSKQIRDYVMSKIKVNILYGRNTWTILKYIKAAKEDFENNKMGKIEHEL